MNVNNYGTVVNQQNIDGQAKGYFNAGGNAQVNEELERIRDIIVKNCTEQQREVLLPVITELSESIQSGKKEASKTEIWMEKINFALSTLGNIATISSAAWWPMLVSGIENLVQRL